MCDSGTKKFTLMFYFASDNPLAISAISQLKAIKAAGFHEQANVIVQFDPFTEGTPTHIFDVNIIEKLKVRNKAKQKSTNNSNHQDGNQRRPLVLSLIDDKLWNGERTREGTFVRSEICKLIDGYDPHHPPNGRETTNGESHELGPQRSLDKFLEFCSISYPAEHYLLFILGHGVVVGNDVFLFDENADEHSLKLGALGNLLRKFSDDVQRGGAKFDLIGFHSCSVSSLEVAYELKDSARYMLASQGTTFVGSWPYREMLQKVFQKLKKVEEEESKSGKKNKNITDFNDENMKQILEEMFVDCMKNSSDFLLAGYPFDLSLFDLSRISTVTLEFEKLSKALSDALKLKNSRYIDPVILAHWKSQSFYQEMYTDLYDFCFCLREKLKDYELKTKTAQALIDACDDVIRVLKTGGEFIVCAETAGPEYQYAHGLSVYFPWSRPPADRRIVEEYREYQISSDFEFTWLQFLEVYWEETMRKTRRKEEELLLHPDRNHYDVAPDKQEYAKHELFEDMVSLVYTQQGARDAQNALDSRTKIDPTDPLGGDCYGLSIKNFPKDIRIQHELKQAGNSFVLSKTFLPT